MPHRGANGRPLRFCLSDISRQRRVIAALVGSVTTSLSSLVHGQEVLPPVLVTTSRASLVLDSPYSLTSLGADTITHAGPGINLSEALSRVPGVVANNRGNYAQDLQISVRGFGSRTSFGVRGIRLYTDGVPATMPDGQGQVTHFNLGAAHRIDVIRGPFSALYGANSGGVIALTSRIPMNEMSASLDVGSFGARHGTAQLGLRVGNLAQHAGVAVEASDTVLDGWRPHARATRTLANARMVMQTNEHTLHAHINHIQQNAQDPLGLTREQMMRDAMQLAPLAREYNTRKDAKQTQAGATLTRSLTAGALRELQASVHIGQRQVTQWQAITPGVQSSPNHPGGVIDLDRDYGGLDARVLLSWPNVSATVGISVQDQADARRGYENFIGTVLGVTGALRRQEQNRAAARDAYGQIAWQATSTLSINGGARTGRLAISSRDAYLANGDDSGQLAFGFTNPVLGASANLGPESTAYLNLGRSYETPTLNELAYRADGASGLNTLLKPQRALQWEFGYRHHSPRSRFEAAVFGAHTADEIVTVSNAGGRAAFHNAARTQRMGLEFSGAMKLAPTLESTTSLTLLRAEFASGFLTCGAPPCSTPTVPVARGNRLPAVPRAALFHEWAWQPGPWQVTLQLRAQDRMAVNDRNSDFAAGFAILNAAVRYRLAVSTNTEALLELRANNLADRRASSSVIVNEANGRFFEPAEPRSVFVGIRVSARR